jgi:hypothetical protein
MDYQNYQQTNRLVQKMVQSLMATNTNYALGYLESFIVSIIEKYVTNENDLTQLRLRIASIGLEHYVTTSKKK